MRPFRSRLACLLVVALLATQAWSQGSPAAAASASRNVYAAGAQVRPAGPVAGDYMAVGGRIVLDQPVQGDAALAGGSIDVRAAVGDDLRIAGGDVSIDAAVGGELFAAGGNVSVAKGGRVAHAARLYGGAVTIDGRVDGPLEAGGQKIVLNGEVGGDVQLQAEQVELGPNAKIAGALRYTSRSELKKAEGASIAGAVTRQEPTGPERRERAERRWQRASWGGSVLSFLALLACAVVFLLVAPGFAARAADVVKATPWLALAVGFGTLVAVPVLAVLLFITVLGIPLGLTALALYPVLLLVGYVVGVLFIARLAQAAIRKDRPDSFGLRVGFYALALLLVMLASRVPFVGGLALGAVTVLGIGACVLELYRRRRPVA